MSGEPPPYNELYIKAWTVLSIILGLILLGMFVFGTELLDAGKSAWDLIRYFARPII